MLIILELCQFKKVRFWGLSSIQNTLRSPSGTYTGGGSIKVHANVDLAAALKCSMLIPAGGIKVTGHRCFLLFQLHT